MLYLQLNQNFLLFVKWRKSEYWLRHFSLSVCLSACPSAFFALNISTPTEENFLKFRKPADKIQVSLKFVNNRGHCAWRSMTNVSGKNYNENQSTPFTFSLFRKSLCLWDNPENHGRSGQATDDNRIRRTRFANSIPKATDTHSEYVIIIAFSLQQWLIKPRLKVTFIRALSALLPLVLHYSSTASSSLVTSVVWWKNVGTQTKLSNLGITFFRQ